MIGYGAGLVRLRGLGVVVGLGLMRLALVANLVSGSKIRRWRRYVLFIGSRMKDFPNPFFLGDTLSLCRDGDIVSKQSFGQIVVKIGSFIHPSIPL